MDIPNETLKVPKIPLDLLKGIKPSWLNIFHQLTELMTDEMLWYIAKADYGCNKDICHKHLKEITTTGNFPSNPEFILIECLELTRWTKPKNKKEHIITAFATILLLILYVKSDYLLEGENETLITLINCMENLDLGFENTQQLLAWIILSNYNLEKEEYLEGEDYESLSEIEIDKFFIYALLITLVFNKEEETKIDIVTDWLINMYKYEKNIEPYYSKEWDLYNQKTNTILNMNQFLLSEGYQRNDLWKEMTEKMLQKIEFIKTPELINNLKYILNIIKMEKI